MSTNKISRVVPEWLAAVAAELNRDFIEIEALLATAETRRLYLGLKLIWVKEMGKEDGSIPHGQFIPWLKMNCPHIPDRSARRYMGDARNAMKALKWQNGQIGRFEVPPHRLLEIPEGELKPKSREQRQLLLDLANGQGKLQPVTDYKQVEYFDDGEREVKLGRRKGEGGRRPLSPGEKLDVHKALAAQRALDLEKLLFETGTQFTGLSDLEGFAEVANIERWLTLRKQWWDKPAAKRDAEALTAECYKMRNSQF